MYSLGKYLKKFPSRVKTAILSHHFYGLKGRHILGLAVKCVRPKKNLNIPSKTQITYHVFLIFF